MNPGLPAPCTQQFLNRPPFIGFVPALEKQPAIRAVMPLGKCTYAVRARESLFSGPRESPVTHNEPLRINTIFLTTQTKAITFVVHHINIIFARLYNYTMDEKKMIDSTASFEQKTKNNANKIANKKFLDATQYLSQPNVLRSESNKKGYLFFRSLLPREELLSLRRQIFQILYRRNLLEPSSDMIDGLANINAISQLAPETFRGNGFPLDIYLEIQKLELFQTIGHDPALIDVFRHLFEAEPFLHPKTIARVVMPHVEVHTTPPHQDFIYIQGAVQTWTAWFPLGDCPRNLGPLSVLEGSHELGILGVSPQFGAGGLESVLCDLDLDWAEIDFNIGDVLIFNSRTVHKALPNTIPSQIRLSCDFRYQSTNDIIDPKSLEPHGPWSWDEIYSGYLNDRLKFYWRKHAFEFSTWDNSLLKTGPKLC